MSMPSDHLGEIFSRVHTGIRRGLGERFNSASPHMKQTRDHFLNLNGPSLLQRAVRDSRFVVIDTETTGFHAYAGDEIISISLVEYLGLHPSGREFNTLVDPRRPIPALSTCVHHITDDQVCDAPVIEEVLPEVAEFLDDSILVGHHINFDVRFLNKTLRKCLLCQIAQPTIDTMLLYLAASGRVGHYSLDEVAASCGVEIVGRHTAAGDARMTGKVFAYLANRLVSPEQPVPTLIDKQTEFGLL